MSAARRPPAFRLLMAISAVLVGSSLLLGAARADEYLHRGIESGDESPLVRHLSGRELGVNADLRQVAPDQLDALAAGLQAQGIRYVRQPFTWSTIEPEPDVFDWSAYDPIVEALNAEGIAVLALLTGAPAWATSPADPGSVESPPSDPEDLGIFVDTLMERYSSQISYLQLWHFPNLRSHWGGNTPDPLAYADMLATTAAAARQRAPSISILTAELAPASGARDTTDIGFLRALYRAGAAPSFDAVALGLPGGTASPFDRWVDPERLTMSRGILFREAIINAGDGDTPVWATSFLVPGAAGPASPELQVNFITGALQRARAEWPWLGPIVLGDSDLSRVSDAAAAASLVGADGLDTRLESLVPIARQFAESSAPGLVPSRAPVLRYAGDWSNQVIGATTLRSTSEQGASVSIPFEGTGVAAVLRQGPTAGAVRITLDGAPLPGTRETNGATVLPLFRFAASDATIPLASGLEDTEHTLTIELSPTETSSADPVDLTFGGIIISRDRPADWPVAVLAGVGLLAIWYAVRESIYVLAIWAGWLRRHRELDLGPPMTSWGGQPRA